MQNWIHAEYWWSSSLLPLLVIVVVLVAMVFIVVPAAVVAEAITWDLVQIVSVFFSLDKLINT